MLVLANILQPLIDVNEAILKFWHNTVGLGWGPSIIGLTIIIRLAILPLTYKQVRSMQEMQRFSPEIQRIRERYKDDKTRQNEELMTLYKEHGFNPLGSCLPLVLQLPFFFGLYQTLRSPHFIAEVHASGNTGFLFIPDITAPLKGHPAALVVMIILYVGTQLGSSYVSSLNVQDKNQRRLLFIFPFVFVPIVINFEAGLLIYWITTNVFTISQQLAIRKFLPAPQPHATGALAAAGGDGGGGASRKRRGGGGGDDGDRSPKPARGGGGDGKATATKAAKASSKSNGKNDGGPAKPPPRSPRKKKKRTGRRR
jgi:YidC/Oxa1 family membrane protein insertase